LPVFTGDGLEVTEYRVDADNVVRAAATFKHIVLLGGVFGDSPAIKKLAKWLSHAAYLGCGYCLLRGTVPAGGHGMYFAGYAQPTCHGTLCPNELKYYGAQNTLSDTKQGYCGDEDIVLSHVAQLARAIVVDGGGHLPTDQGCHGTSPFVEALDYVDYNNLFVVPIAHAGLLGVVKDFWNHVLQVGKSAEWYTVCGEARRVLQGRASCVVPTCDFGRRYTDIISKKGNWVMEDWLHWAECWSVFMLQPYVADGVTKQILDPRADEMWQHLRAGLLYFCRSYPVEGVAQSVNVAAEDLLEYAVLVERHFGLQMCKYNLHLLVCRIARQEAARGRVAHSTEYWLENLIQWAKSTVRYRTTKYPELVLAGDILLDDAIARCFAKHDCVRAKLDAWQHVDVVGSTFSNPDAGGMDGSQLLGKGQVLSAAEREAWGVDAAVQTYIEDYQPAGWHVDMVSGSSVLLYKYAQAQGRILHSTQYTRAQSRVSYNVLCRRWEGERELDDGPSSSKGDGTEFEVTTHYIGKINFFVKVVPPCRMEVDEVVPVAGDVPAADLRLAVMDLHLVQRLDMGMGVLYQSVTYCSGAAALPNTALPLCYDEEHVGHMVSKHVMAQEDGVAFFLPYSNMSASGEDV
jgi:hypothetical protein